MVSGMQKKLVSIGNSLGLVIEKPILDLLKIQRETVLEISTDGESLIIRPVRAESDDVLASVERMSAIHREAFEKLAK